MAIQVQLRRGTATQNNAFTGANGELSFDTTANQVRIHDGSTAGGFKIGVGNFPTGTNNVAVGNTPLDSLDSSSPGGSNTAVGHDALTANTTASNNVAVGKDALKANSTAASSTAVGTSALAASNGTLNTAFGKDAGSLITSGTKNTIIGSFDGNQGDLDIRTSDSHIVLSDGDGNPRLIIDNNGNVDIGGETTELKLKNTTHEDTDGGRESKITFQGEQSGGEQSVLAQIQASHDATADDQKGDLIFRTNDGSDNTSPTEAMRIDSAQTIGIGTAAPSPTGLAIVTGGGAKGVMLTRNDGSGNPTSGQGFGSFGFKGVMDGSNSLAAAEASIEAIASENHSGSTAGTDLAFYTKPAGTGPGSGPTERWRITSTGNLKAATSGLGIDFAATSDANGTAASELFDDYERGSWSPAIVDLGGNAATMATANGKYTKIGSQVIANFGCTISSKGSMTGSYVFISGIPYNHTGSNAGTGIINRYANLSTAASSIALEIGGGIASAAWFTRVTGTSGTADGYLAPSEINSNFFIQGTLIYTVN